MWCCDNILVNNHWCPHSDKFLVGGFLQVTNDKCMVELSTQTRLITTITSDKCKKIFGILSVSRNWKKHEISCWNEECKRAKLRQIYMERVVQDAGEHWSMFAALPTELLVLIFSFLCSTRDKVKVRYVSHRLRSGIETSSLWRTFVWPYYDDREELHINNVLETCGKYVKKMALSWSRDTT